MKLKGKRICFVFSNYLYSLKSFNISEQIKTIINKGAEIIPLAFFNKCYSNKKILYFEKEIEKVMHKKIIYLNKITEDFLHKEKVDLIVILVATGDYISKIINSVSNSIELKMIKSHLSKRETNSNSYICG